VNKGLIVGELVQGLVDEGVEAARPAGQGDFEAAGDDQGERVVGHDLKHAGGDRAADADATPLVAGRNDNTPRRCRA
jgi:hypothetical protein